MSVIGICALVGMLTAMPTEASVDRHDVVWQSPSEDSSGSMPLGNGEIGLNVWATEKGISFYLARTDAWSESCRLLKLGRIDLRLSPNPFDSEQFEQRLRLRNAEVEIAAGEPGRSVTVLVWVDAHHPVVNVEVRAERAVHAVAGVAVWRTTERELRGDELHSAYGLSGAPHPVIVHPDTVLQPREGRLVWYHRNEQSMWAETMRVQGLEGWMEQAQDPLLQRTFGGTVFGHGMQGRSPTKLVSDKAARRHTVRVVCHQARTDSADEWLGQVAALAEATGDRDLDADRGAHRRWWADFWSRSYIDFSGSLTPRTATENDLPLRIGADSEGGNRFRGMMRVARVYGRALGSEEIRRLAQSADAATPTRGPIGEWRPGQMREGTVANVASDGLSASVQGSVGVAEVEGDPAFAFDGGGWLEVADDPALDLTEDLTLEAWVWPEELPEGGARIIDKTAVGTSEAYLLDTYPGNSLRLITDPATIVYDADLPTDRWTHVAATFGGEDAAARLYVDGEMVAERGLGATAAEVCRRYALQRFIAACAGRGEFPIKFNGSLFTVDAHEQGFDADYRRWGGPYWFQNTRLPYWPMPASGDAEMMLPLFEMYMRALPMARYRTREYFDHEGAFFPETMYFWGAYANDNYGWERPEELPECVPTNRFIRHYYSGAIELVALMLRYEQYTGDEEFVAETLVPFAAEIMAFYDERYPRDAGGRLLLRPAQALETYQKAVNPLPPIAGLRCVLPRLLELSAEATGPHRERWERLLGELPPLPMRSADGQVLLAPAEEVLEEARNVENPELYAIFPYRLYGVGRPDLEVARRTFAERRVRGARGWQQDDTQAARLGLAEVASALMTQRFGSTHAASRFPAFWGPNFDWVPDQDHGSNALMALQSMLLQVDGERILLLPAWPARLDVSFRLHAPGRTTVECEVREGGIERLDVTPASRRADVEIIGPVEGARTDPD